MTAIDRAEEGLIQRRQRAVAAWQRHAEKIRSASVSEVDSRETRMDVQRSLGALRRTQAALHARSRDTLLQSQEVLGRTGARAMLVHRNTWLRTKVADRLEELGVAVVAQADDGADGLGITVVEQPDLLLVEDRLPSLPTVELVRQVREFSPETLIAAQAEHDHEIGALLDAGCSAVFTRRVPPAAVADEIVTLLHDPPPEPVVVR